MARSAEARDTMVARVQSAVAVWPTFLDMPEGPSPSEGTKFVFAPLRAEPASGNSAYVEALYELSHRGATPVGRVKGEATIVGEVAQ